MRYLKIFPEMIWMLWRPILIFMLIKIPLILRSRAAILRLQLKMLTSIWIQFPSTIFRLDLKIKLMLSEKDFSLFSLLLYLKIGLCRKKFQF